MQFYLKIPVVLTTVIFKILVWKCGNVDAASENNKIEFNREHVMVLFDPRPYPDKTDYKQQDILPLVELVSKKFSKLLFDPTLDGSYNITKVALAVANFNKKNIAPFTRTRLWIHVPFIPKYVNFTNNTKFLEYIRKDADKANTIFTGSVEGLIFSSEYFAESLTNDNSSNQTNPANEIARIFRQNVGHNYKIAVQYTNITIASKLFPNVLQSSSEIQACCVMLFLDPKARDMENSISDTISKFQKILSNLKVNIEKININLSKVDLILRTGYPDSSNNSKAKHRYNDLVQYWTSMSDSAVKENITIAFTEAFDVPTRHSLASSSLGWWTLAKDDDEEDALLEKVEILNMKVAESITAPENLDTVISQLANDQNFKFRDYPRTIAQLNPKYVAPDITESKVIYLLDKISSKFREISIKDESMNFVEIEKFLEILAGWNNRKSSYAVNTSIAFSMENLGNHGNWDTKCRELRDIIKKTNNLHFNTITSVQLSMDLEKLEQQKAALSLAKYRMVDEDPVNISYKFGMEVPLKTCNKNYTETILSLVNFVKVITFNYNVNYERARKGVVKNVRSITKKFLQCRNSISNVNKNIHVFLSTGWPDSDISGVKDYASFVRFWYEMSIWARQNNATLVMKEAIDNSLGQENFGWWKTLKQEGEVGFRLEEKRKIWIDENPKLNQGIQPEVKLNNSHNSTNFENNLSPQSNHSLSGNTNSTTNVSSSSSSNNSTFVPSNRSMNIPVKKILASDSNQESESPSEDSWFWITWGVPTACAIIVSMIVAMALVYKMKQNKRELSKVEAKEFFDGSRKRGDDLGEEQYINGAYNEINEVPLQSIVFDSVVGSGKFAIFYKAMLASNIVAVKAPKKDCTKQYYKSMLMEVKIMAGIGDHANVVRFYGSCTKDIRKGMVYTVMEYCENGTLHGYLRSLRYNLESQDEEMAKALQDISELYKFSHEIASGMQYLNDKDVIHGDLSAVNVLLSSNQVCKVSNFGLSRKLDDNGEYIRRNDATWPWRWIALETLKHKIVTARSDLWSYGVTLWEIFSLGRIPYKNYTLEGFLEKVEKGLRLKRPKYATQDVYDTMMQCWSKNPADRPRFQEQSEYFLLLMREEADQVDKNC